MNPPKSMTLKFLLCNPEIEKFLSTIERTDDRGYPEKTTCGLWEVNNELIPCGANFPGGRTEIKDLILLLRQIIKPSNKKKTPWSDFLEFDHSPGLEKEIERFDLDLSSRDPLEIWTILTQTFCEMRYALLLVKLFAELWDETRVARKEVKVLGLISNFIKPYYKTNPETGKWELDEKRRRIVEKRIDTYYYLATTEAEGLPRVTYRQEIIGSAWFDLSNPSKLLYQGCHNFLKRQNTQHLLRDWQESQLKKLAQVGQLKKPAINMSEEEEKSYERWAEKTFPCP